MSSPKVAVAKPGVDVTTETDPNQFIFHSDYNTFKIIGQGTQDFTVPANSTTSFAVDHGLEQIPLVRAFMNEDGTTSVIAPNNGIVTNLSFEDVRANYTQIIFNITNHSSSDTIAHISYLMFEVPL